MNPIKCPYCGKDSLLVNGQVIYKKEKYAHLNFWYCEPCGAWVGCHRVNKKLGFTGVEPFGTLANKELREARREAHLIFDPTWQNTHKDRSKAYRRLAALMRIKVSECHIAMFDLEQCRRLKELFSK